MTDIEIAHNAKVQPIATIAQKIGLTENDLESYGPTKAKITMAKLRELQAAASNKPATMVLVTAITPTAAGEGKSTVSIGLADALQKLGKRTSVALREPSLGPCFGVKGGACGGGFAQIVPMEDINLHFTGDLHAITSANNLISALIDNSIQQANPLNIDPRTITHNRCVDLNDRALRNCTIALGGTTNGVPREEHFSITAASEVMAIVCLSRTISELKEKLGSITIGKTFGKKRVTFGELGCTGAVAALLKDAIRPNLVQTLEGTPAFVHGGPFANIAHGCNSINATLCALGSSDFVVTEAGFGADLGAEKFMDIKCRMFNLRPSAVVIVASVRALKMHGGVAKENLTREDVAALQNGFCNLKTHIENVRKFGVDCVVAINRFTSDTDTEVKTLQDLCANMGVDGVETTVWANGGNGALDLAKKVVRLAKQNNFRPLYPSTLSLVEKINVIAQEIYRADCVDFAPVALKKLASFQDEFGSLPVCIAKTQNSISHDPLQKGAPSGYKFPVRDAKVSSGAGFVVVYAGDIMTMPGLPKVPATANIDVDDAGVVSGLF